MVLLNASGRLLARRSAVHLADTGAQGLTAAAAAAFGQDVWLLHDGGLGLGRRDFPARFEALESEGTSDQVAPSLPHARPWQRPGWRSAALEWAASSLGTAISGAAWVHTSDVGAVLRLQTAEETMYLKTLEDGREVRATVQVAEQAPGLTPDVLAADPQRGWLLTRDAGTNLLQSPALEEWQCAVQKLAWVHRQLQLAEVPTHDFRALPGQIERLLSPAVLTGWGLSEERQQLVALLPELLGIHRQTSALGLSGCACHGDFHANNVLVQGTLMQATAVRLFDWSEACTAHPLTDLGWYLAFVMHPARAELPLRAAHPGLGDTLWQAYQRALGMQTDLRWQQVALLALLHRSVLYDARYRAWVGTLPGFRPNYVPYYLQMALKFSGSLQS